ncbi:MAG: heme exporter protein CcmD [Gammaproteobacteria bacterium]|nr:heme exporter protein CcmD [Gammaproteobacteria bacterium]MDH5592937.1 heme exporter protein CcmD [Gammaproteobacteria bacterium]MDH5613419.1 heme exporter protein CcmD [Gammaproteobacteria bacterium]
MTFAEFIDMGGYGSYVWSSYGIALVVLVANVVIPLLSARKQKRELLGKLKRMENS